jgi:Domain of unknown function (DUF4386)
MMERIADGSHPPNARLIGLVYLSYFLIGVLGDYFIKRVVISGDPTATAANLLAHEATYRSGFAIGLVANAMYIALTGLFYRLLKPVSPTIALLMALFSVVGCTVQIIAGILELAPLVVLRDAQLLAAFNAEQLRAAALVCLKLYSQTYNISFVLFAFFDFLIGYLIFKSTFLPRFIGVLMMAAGVIASAFLYPPLAIALKWFVLPAAALPEAVLMLWLIIKGVNVARWQERACYRPAVS